MPSQGTNGGNEFPAFPAVPGNGTPSNAQPQNDFPAFPSVPGATGNSGGNDFPAFPSVPGATGSGSAATGSGGDLPGFDELNSRFEALKKKK